MKPEKYDTLTPVEKCEADLLFVGMTCSAALIEIKLTAEYEEAIEEHTFVIESSDLRHVVLNALIDKLGENLSKVREEAAKA